MYKQPYFKRRKVDVILRDERDATIEGIQELEEKKSVKKAGSVTFHIDDTGIVQKVHSDKWIKKKNNL